MNVLMFCVLFVLTTRDKKGEDEIGHRFRAGVTMACPSAVYRKGSIHKRCMYVIKSKRRRLRLANQVQRHG
jgi:hypothetical protein